MPQRESTTGPVLAMVRGGVLESQQGGREPGGKAVAGTQVRKKMMVVSMSVVRWGWREVLERDLGSHVSRGGIDDRRAYGGSFQKSKVSLSKRNL